jgi:hypothetical protein
MQCCVLRPILYYNLKVLYIFTFFTPDIKIILVYFGKIILTRKIFLDKIILIQ